MRALGLVALCGCRIHFDPLGDDAPADDAVAQASDTAVACPANYAAIGPTGSRYLVESATPVNWVSAEQRCELDGAHLSIVDTESERMAIVNLLPGQSQWSGISERVSRGTFLTVINLPATFLPWAAGEPSGSLDDCVQLDGTTMQLDDQSCASVRRYVCECDGVIAVPASY